MSMYSWYRSKIGVSSTDTRINNTDIDSESIGLLDKALSSEEMEPVDIFDCNGDRMSLTKYRDCLWPNTMRYVDSVGDLECRHDDILLCSYPRSGTHWIWHILCTLLNGDCTVNNLDKNDLMLEYRGCDHLKTLPSPRVMNTHINPSLLPSDVFKQKCKMILMLRNPKDVAVSYFNFCTSRRHYEYDGQFPAFLELFLKGKTLPYGSWFKHIEEWDNLVQNGSECPIYVIYYDQLKQDFGRIVRSLASFLCVSRPDEFYEELEKVTCVDTLKRAYTNEKSEWKGEPGYIRQGLSGEWKKWFTVNQNERFDTVFNKHLYNTRFLFDLT